MTVDAARNTTATVSVHEVAVRFGRGRGAVDALRGVTVDIAAGQFIAIMGPSGSGKSTLLQCAAGLERPTSGRVRLEGADIAGMSQARLSKLRRERIGFVFQDFNLLPAFTARDNIGLPLRLSGRRPDPAWLAEIVARTGLGDRLDHRPGELSGGQRQRVAIARALVARPAVVFADEPTGALDLRAGAEVLELLRTVVDAFGQTLVMVTHDPVAASYADLVLFLADGLIVDTLRQPDAATIAARMNRLGA